MYFNVISNPTFLHPRNCFVDSSKASWQLPKATSHVPSAVRRCPVTNKSRDRMGFGLCCYGVHHYCCHDPHHNELNHDAFGILHQKYLSLFIMIHVLSKVIIIFFIIIYFHVSPDQQLERNQSSKKCSGAETSWQHVCSVSMWSSPRSTAKNNMSRNPY